MDMPLDISVPILISVMLVAGCASGLMAGLLGVGGGVVLVPVLFQIFVFFNLPENLQMHMAVGTSLAIICFTGARSAQSHWRLGAIDKDILIGWCGFVAMGALAGALAARYVVPDGLKLVFAVISLSFGVQMLANNWRTTPATPSQNSQSRAVIGAVLQKIGAFFVGLLSALMGIGGGTLSVPLIEMAGRTTHKAVGTSAALGVVVAVPASIGFIIGGMALTGRPPFSLGYISLPALAIITPITMLAAPLGAKLAHRLSQRTLALIFAAFLLASGGRMVLAIYY